MTWEEYAVLTVRVEKAKVLREDYENLLNHKQNFLNLKKILEETFDNKKYNEYMDTSLTRLVGGDKSRKIRAIDILVKFIDDEMTDLTKQLESI